MVNVILSDHILTLLLLKVLLEMAMRLVGDTTIVVVLTKRTADDDCNGYGVG